MNSNNAMNNKGAFNQALNNVKKASTKHKVYGVVVLVIILAVIIYLLWSMYNDYMQRKENEPWLVPTTKIARTSKLIPGSMIKPSNDSRYGIEFTYALWIYVTDWTYKSGEYKHVFHKGNASAKPLQAPGVWLYPKENKIAINMNTFHSVKETCDIGNIPIGKWFHLTVSVIGKNMDVYINGRLKKRCELIGVPKQNLGDLYINAFNGFDGFISKFRYFNYAIPYYKVEQMVSDGPSKAPCTETGSSPPYLAKDFWFSSGFPNAVNF
jgi:hypothetical protein